MSGVASAFDREATRVLDAIGGESFLIGFKPSALSGCQQQRVAIARALANDRRSFRLTSRPCPSTAPRSTSSDHVCVTSSDAAVP